MKRLLFAALVLLGVNAASFAQTTPETKKQEGVKTQHAGKAAHKKEMKGNKTIVADTAVAHKPGKKHDRNDHAATPASASKPARDGKPAAAAAPNAQASDKSTAHAAGPLKKDGTPDKRYKANQRDSAGPAKKDGTPDMRYKANKKKAAK